MYLHRNKEENDYTTENEGLEFADNEAATNFLYALCEVEFDVEVDLDDGDVKILKVNGRRVLYE